MNGVIKYTNSEKEIYNVQGKYFLFVPIDKERRKYTFVAHKKNFPLKTKRIKVIEKAMAV